MEEVREVKVRVGVPEDFYAIMNLALDLCKENGLFSPDMSKVEMEVWASLHQDKGIVGVIGEVGGPLEGFVLLRIGNSWYSGEEMLEERCVFVSKKFRKVRGGRARRLCEFAKKVSEELGMVLLIGVLSSQRTESKARLYNRIFGKPAGVFYLHGRKTGDWSMDQPASVV